MAERPRPRPRGARDANAAVDRARHTNERTKADLDADLASARHAHLRAQTDLERGGIDAGLLPHVPDHVMGDARERTESLLLVVERRRDRVREVRDLARSARRAGR